MDGRLSMTCGQINEVSVGMGVVEVNWQILILGVELHEMGLIDERSTAILRHVLEGEYSESSSHSSFSPAALQGRSSNIDKENFLKLRDGYTACMNEELIAKRGLDPLLKFVKQLKEVYPLAEASEAKEKPKKPVDSTVDLTDAIAYLQDIGLAGFIDFGISVRAAYSLFSISCLLVMGCRPTTRTQIPKF